MTYSCIALSRCACVLCVGGACARGGRVFGEEHSSVDIHVWGCSCYSFVFVSFWTGERHILTRRKLVARSLIRQTIAAKFIDRGMRIAG
jgi:hypothetical protein